LKETPAIDALAQGREAIIFVDESKQCCGAAEVIAGLQEALGKESTKRHGALLRNVPKLVPAHGRASFLAGLPESLDLPSVAIHFARPSAELCYGIEARPHPGPMKAEHFHEVDVTKAAVGIREVHRKEGDGAETIPESARCHHGQVELA
jgi:hypothetical protein